MAKSISGGLGAVNLTLQELRLLEIKTTSIESTNATISNTLTIANSIISDNGTFNGTVSINNLSITGTFNIESLSASNITATTTFTYNGTELTTILSGYVLTTTLNTTLGDYVLTTALNTTLGNYVLTTALNTTLSDYVLTSALNTTLSDYVLTSALNTTLSDYVLTSALNTTLGDYVLTSALNTTLSDYVLTTALNTTLSDYVLTTALNTTLSNYVLTSALTTTLSGYSQLPSTSSTPTAFQVMFYDDTTNLLHVDSQPTQFTFNPSGNELKVGNVIVNSQLTLNNISDATTLDELNIPFLNSSKQFRIAQTAKPLLFIPNEGRIKVYDIEINRGGGANGNSQLNIVADTDNSVEASCPQILLTKDGGSYVGSIRAGTDLDSSNTNAENNMVFRINDSTGSDNAFYFNIGGSEKMVIGDTATTIPTLNNSTINTGDIKGDNELLFLINNNQKLSITTSNTTINNTLNTYQIDVFQDSNIRLLELSTVFNGIKNTVDFVGIGKIQSRRTSGTPQLDLVHNDYSGGDYQIRLESNKVKFGSPLDTSKINVNNLQLNYMHCYDKGIYTCTDGSGNTDFGDYNRITWANTTGILTANAEYGHKLDGTHTTAGAWNTPSSGGQLSLVSNDYVGTWRIEVEILYTNLLTGNSDRISPMIIIQKNNINEKNCMAYPNYVRFGQGKVSGCSLSCIINPSSTSDVYTINTRLNKGSTTDFSDTVTDAQYDGTDLKIRFTYLGNLSYNVF